MKTTPNHSVRGAALRFSVAAVGVLALALGVTTVGFAASATTTLVSVDAPGATVSNLVGDNPSISADGRYVAFASWVPSNPSVPASVFVRDLVAGTTRVASSGAPSGDDSYQPSISADGRYVAFMSEPDRGPSQVYVQDMGNGATTLVSQTAAGQPGNWSSSDPAISANGRFVAFESFATNLAQPTRPGLVNILVNDLKTGKTQAVCVPPSGRGGPSPFCHHPSISANGRFVAFTSNLRNQVPADTNNTADAFVRDLKKQKTKRVSVSSAGTEAKGRSAWASISADGHCVAFQSKAGNLVRRDTNRDWDVFVRDLASNKTTRVSVDSAGKQGNDGSYVPSISRHGDYIAFESSATNLVPVPDTNNGEDVFVHYGRSGTTVQASLDAAGHPTSEAYGNFMTPSISADGRYVAFVTPARLVPADTDDEFDLYLRGPLHG